MPRYKLLIDYTSEVPFYPYDHVKIEGRNCALFFNRIGDLLRMGTDTGDVIPIDDDGKPVSNIPILHQYTRKKERV